MDAMNKALRANADMINLLERAALARKRRDKAVREAHAAQIKPGHIAKVLGISAGRVTQIVSGAKEAE